MQNERAGMNIVLWIAQVLSGIVWSMTGLGKIMFYQADLWHQAVQQVHWFSAIPQGLMVFIGACEFLGGIGLILPAMTGVKPKLTPFAAMGLTTIMILAAGFHIVRGEYGFVTINVVLGGMTAFIAYGRLVMRPNAPASFSALRVITGVAVLAALAFVGFAPAWDRLMHLH